MRLGYKRRVRNRRSTAIMVAFGMLYLRVIAEREFKEVF